MPAAASWEETSNQTKIDFQITRDCQSIAGFLLLSKPSRSGWRERLIMNANYRKVVTDFGPETRFTVTPFPAAPFRATVETAFERLKNQLLLERLKQLADPKLNSQVRRIANEAAELAWVTAYPLLVFPGLFQEKTDSVLDGADQHDITSYRAELLGA
jgi:hypothetical protein